MSAKNKGKVTFTVIRLNLLDGPKFIKRQVGISWTTFWVSVILIAIMTAAPIITMKTINSSLSKKVNSLNSTYASLKAKEARFHQVIKQKNNIMKFIDNAYNLINMQPKISIVLQEIRKRLPKGSTVQGGMNLGVNGDSVMLSLKIVSDSYLDAPQLIDAFASSPYLYVKDVKVTPINVNSISKAQEDKWTYSVNLVLGWKQDVKEGEGK